MMNKELGELILETAWGEDDSPAREEARREVLAYMDCELENVKAVITELKEYVENLEVLINATDAKDEIKNYIQFVDEKWLANLYLIQWQDMLELMENANVLCQKKWRDEEESEAAEKEKIKYLLNSVTFMEKLIDNIELNSAEN